MEYKYILKTDLGTFLTTKGDILSDNINDIRTFDNIGDAFRESARFKEEYGITLIVERMYIIPL
jgi:hypothetical protein